MLKIFPNESVIIQVCDIFDFKTSLFKTLNADAEFSRQIREFLAEFEESLGTESWQQCRENLKVLTDNKETFLVMTRQF